jgi:hypothetical protein
MERDTQVRLVRDDSGQFEVSDRWRWTGGRYFGTPRSLALGATSAQRLPSRGICWTIAAPGPTGLSNFAPTSILLAADGSTWCRDPGIRRSTRSRKGDLCALQWRRILRPGGSGFLRLPAGSDVDGFRLYQGTHPLPPGLWRFLRHSKRGHAGAILPRRAADGSRLREGTFALSGITLAARLEPAPNPESDPFLVGRLLMSRWKRFTRPGPTWPTISGVPSGHGSEDRRSKPGYHLSFLQASSLQKTENRFKPLGKAQHFENQTGLVHGYAFPSPAGRPANLLQNMIG